MSRVEIANEGCRLAVTFQATDEAPTTFFVPPDMAAQVGAALLGAADLGVGIYTGDASARFDFFGKIAGPRFRGHAATSVSVAKQPTSRLTNGGDGPVTLIKGTEFVDALAEPELLTPLDATVLNDPAAIERGLRELEKQRSKIDAQIRFLRELLAVEIPASRNDPAKS